jgi:hypothetical protein
MRKNSKSGLTLIALLVIIIGAGLDKPKVLGLFYVNNAL